MAQHFNFLVELINILQNEGIKLGPRAVFEPLPLGSIGPRRKISFDSVIVKGFHISHGGDLMDLYLVMDILHNANANSMLSSTNMRASRIGSHTGVSNVERTPLQVMSFHYP